MVIDKERLDGFWNDAHSAPGMPRLVFGSRDNFVRDLCRMNEQHTREMENDIRYVRYVLDREDKRGSRR